jgi:hypothetical protein
MEVEGLEPTLQPLGASIAREALNSTRLAGTEIEGSVVTVDFHVTHG